MMANIYHDPEIQYHAATLVLGRVVFQVSKSLGTYHFYVWAGSVAIHRRWES